MSDPYIGSCEQLPFCCGFYEAGSFGRDSDDYFYSQTQAKTADELLDTFCEEASGRPIIFNFVRERDIEEKWDTPREALAAAPFKKRYEAQWMRRLVKKHPKVIHVGKSINPGTLNEIDTYILKDYSE